ncbi:MULTISPECIES: mechanosensitive ion channel domain-containing protein [Methylomonas]|uniref:mechanosensitive ion channel domain-containing protein n=1 Tax=Methylomonas TaxID=416 RepID=UPI0012321CDB|nr:mechanosensitive ion channel domain-containing protein [Methylomonas rhizoryzae]
MKYSLFVISLLVCWLGLAANAQLAYAGTQKSLNVLVLPEIEQRIQSVKDKQNLAEDVKNRVISAYQESADNLREIKNQEQQAEAYKRAIKELPLQTKRLQAEIAEAERNLTNGKSERFSDLPSDELEQHLIILKSRLSDLDAEIAQNDTAISDLTNGPQRTREKIADIKAKQLGIQQELQTLAGGQGASLIEMEARQVQLDTRANLLNNTQKALELENIINPMRLQLQKDQRHLLGIKREQLALSIDALDNSLLERRQAEISKEQAVLAQAEKDAEGKHPLIKAATKINIAYNQNLREVNDDIEKYLAKKSDLESRYNEVQQDYKSAEQKISLAGLSPALGNLLREQRRSLPERKRYSALNDMIQQEISRSSLEMFKLEDEKKALVDVNQTLADALAANVPPDTSPGEVLRIRAELRMLLNDRKDLIGRLAIAYAAYARVLGDVDFTLQQLLNAADSFGSYLDQRLLWVPSAPVIGKDYLNNMFHALIGLLSPSAWLSVGNIFLQGLGSNPLVCLPALAVVGLNLRFRKSVKARLAGLLNKTGASRYLMGFGHTLDGIACLLLLSLSAPLLMLWAGWTLNLAKGGDDLSRALASGLTAAALSLGMVQFFYRLFKPDSVAELLFHWKARTTNLLYRQFKWARFVIIPCIFLIGMSGNNAYSEYSHALGRSAQIVLMLTLSFVLHCLTHPVTGVAKNYFETSDNWISRLRYVWYAAIVLLPWVVIGFSAAGYYQSALELQQKLISTLRLVFVVALIHALVTRWLTVTKRELALQSARQKRKQAEQQAGQAVGDEGAAFVADEATPDLSKIQQQSNKLLSTLIVVMLAVGCWMIWSSILPALSVFDQVVLWEHLEVLDGKEVVQAVTLINLLAALLYMGLTVILVGNFPALVDLLLVGRFDMTAGSRYALIQLGRYLWVSIAFLAVANELGGSWTQVQWLVAALGVGLGFGLQEIFANLVSGIILLFERPIRVGDVVTVGEVTGRVSRIQMRATHIIDWDLKELVVPNKNIITDRLVNWTLSDTMTRLEINIGVAYGTDIEQVETLLRQVVGSVEKVLKEPEPVIVFAGFGESSVDFRIFAYVRELSDRLPTTNALYKGIYKALQQHSIEIPFPQRDIHVRSVAPGILGQ